MKRRKADLLPRLLVLCFLTAASVFLRDALFDRALAAGLLDGAAESPEFRDLNICEENLTRVQTVARESSRDFSECLAAALVQYRFDLSSVHTWDANQFLRLTDFFVSCKPKAFSRLADACEQIFSDLVYFPIPDQSQKNTRSIFFEDGYGEPRSYGGARSHEGIDLFGREEEEGYYPVVSVTDGTVEKVGWLPLGGYRIGIRSPHGGYFYYAHLASYEKAFQVGDAVWAGEVLGLMGSTGYGEEGTRGRFPVHLHFGIYIRTDHYEELSVNPYPVLQMLKNQTEEYPY